MPEPCVRHSPWRERLERSAALAVGWPLFALADQARRGLAAFLERSDSLSVRAPSRCASATRGVKLHRYAGNEAGPAILLIPAPIKAAYIWDLLPRASVVRTLLRAGFRVYLIEWEEPGANEADFGLAQYADRLIAFCCDAIRAETGAHRLPLAGHSLGGTLAALFAALHPDRVHALVLLGAPLHFDPQSGSLGRAAQMIPPGAHLPAIPGNVPGTLLASFGLIASPRTFVWSRWADLAASLADSDALQSYLAVERWTLHEMPIARRLFLDIVQSLLRDNGFMRGVLRIDGGCARPGNVTAAVLAIVDPRCAIAPPRSVQPFLTAVASKDVKMLKYGGDRGVSLQHIGMLVGRNAHRRLWPKVIAWLGERANRG